MRARLALDVSELACELREITLRDKPLAMLRVSPKGTVPVLVDAAGVVIEESLDIMLWALRLRDPELWLTPERGTLEAVLALIHRFDAEFKPLLDRYKYPDRFEGADAEASRHAASLWLLTLDERLQDARYLFGERAGLADMALAPFVRQFANVDAAWFASRSWTHLQAWLTAIVDSARFARIMRPIAVWQAGSPGVPLPLVP